MEHVIVETNWVVEYAAPSHRRTPEALSLLAKAASGEITLHVPTICLVEARRAIRNKAEFRPNNAELNGIREFTRTQAQSGAILPADADAFYKRLQWYQQVFEKEKAEAPQRIRELRAAAGVDVFPVGEPILERSIELSFDANVEQQAFDFAILAAVLVRGAALSGDGSTVCFCSKDADLQPWEENRRAANLSPSRQRLRELYDAAGVWVFGDFARLKPARPAGWPAPAAPAGTD